MKKNNVLDRVEKRATIAGKNRIELLLFKIRGEQLYGINVFKVKEIISMSSVKYSLFPGRNDNIIGMTHIRGETIDLIDLSGAIEQGKFSEEELQSAHIIVSEFNRTIQGFIVAKVERIINISWEDIQKPPLNVGGNNYLTAVTNLEGEMVEILDVEKILSEVINNEDFSSLELLEVSEPSEEFAKYGIPPLIIIDDSKVLHKQVTSIFQDIGVGFIRAWDGEEGLRKLKNIAHFNDVNKEVLMIILDLEMPKRDGYSLLKEIRSDPNLKDLHVCIHSSISGVFNEDLILEIGGDRFLTKFDSDQLREEILSRVKIWKETYGEK